MIANLDTIGMATETRRELNVIAQAYGYATWEQARDMGRVHHACLCRADCYRYLANVRKWSTPKIGKLFGRDHTTVLWWLDRCGSKPSRKRLARLRYLAKSIASERRP